MLGESEGTSGAATIEEIGRRRSFGRTTLAAGILLAVQLPMTHAVGVRAGDAVACAEPGRLSLLVDSVFIVAYLLAAYRCYKYVRCLRQPGWTKVAAAGVWLVGLTAILDAVEDVLLWRELGTTGACYGMTTGALSSVLLITGLLGLLVLAVCLVCTGPAFRRRLRGVVDRPDPSVRKRVADTLYVDQTYVPSVSFKPEKDPGPDEGRLVICCSGGGIRSASFCLGALQLLSDRRIYHRASSVIGVSGGGYMAAAFHVMRSKLTDPGAPGPYAPGSPELARLRRQTRYLLQGPRAKSRAALSLLFGLCVNLLLIGVTLRAVAWVLGWYLADLKVVTPDPANPGRLLVDWRPDGSSRFLVLATLPLAVGIGLFAVEKITDRFGTLPDLLRRGLGVGGGLALSAGLPIAALLLGVPGGLDLLNRLVRDTPLAGASEQPTLPQVLLDLVDPNKQGVAAFAALAVALVGLGRTVWKGLSVEGGDPAESSLRRRVLGFLRIRIAPWLGTAIILAAVVIVLLRWTGGYATDPAYRSNWSVAALLAGIAVLVRVLTDANRTSLHPFYRERLSTAYLVRRDPRTGAAVSLDYSEPLHYSVHGKAPDGVPGPQLIVAAVANVSDADFVPSQRDCVPFVFDPTAIGIVGDSSLPAGGRRETAAYELEADYLRREVTVPAAMAISGAAFSPLTGRANARTRPVRMLLALLNARLGVWLPNPYWNSPPVDPTWYQPPRSVSGRVRRYLRSIADKPGAYRMLREAVGSPSMYDRRLYVTDGGHYDNLGLVEALRRRPAQAIVIDASNDPEDRFSTLGEAIATARMDHGIEIEIDPTPMIRGTKGRAEQAWVYGIATHPQRDDEDKPEKTEIFFLKALLADSPGWDVEQYAAQHADFPRRSTGDQFYGEWDFEAYRALGHTLARSLVDDRRVAARLATLDPQAPSPNGQTGTVSEPASVG